MEMFRTQDWRTEKHVPVIEVLERKENLVTVRVTVGKEIPHPNTTEHHIRWISLYFWPENDPYPFEVGKADFNAHGESVQGPNTSGVYTEPVAHFTLKVAKPGKLVAFSYCNIHGLWKNEEELKL